MAWNSRSSLEDLKSRVFRFGVEWRQQTGRRLVTARDGIDFLTSMKGRDDFWAALAPSDPADVLPIDAPALRAALPSSELPEDVDAEAYLRSIGLSEAEIDVVITGLDATVLLEGAIRSAFQEQTPQKVARALERVLDGDQDVLAAESYVGRLGESSGIGRTLGVLMGTAVLLVGTTLASCVSHCGGPTTQPTPRTDQQGTTTPQPVPNSGGTSPDTPPPPPEPPPPPPPEPPPNNPPPTPAYKGVSPRRIKARSRATSATTPPK